MKLQIYKNNHIINTVFDGSLGRTVAQNGKRGCHCKGPIITRSRALSAQVYEGETPFLVRRTPGHFDITFLYK